MPRKATSLFAQPEGLLQAFSVSRYPAGIGQAVALSLTRTKRETRGLLRERCPAGPGVYGFIDRMGNLTYVGMSSDLQRRLSTYFASRMGHRKEFRIGRKCTQVYWQPVAHTFLARLRELELIHRFRPQDNVEGQPTRTSLGYIVQSGGNVPFFEIQSQVTKKTRFMWGPLPAGRHTREAVEELNRAFLLRDCAPSNRMLFKDELRLLDAGAGTPCLRADLGTCLSPCIGGCTRKDYVAAVTRARKFLNGAETNTLSQLRDSMCQAVKEQKFERAARLRDITAALERLDLLLRWFHDWLEKATFVYSLPAMHPEFAPLGVVVVRGLITDIAAAQGRHALGTLLRQHTTSPAAKQLTAGERLAKSPPEQFEIARFLFRWFRRYPQERERLFRSGRRRAA